MTSSEKTRDRRPPVRLGEVIEVSPLLLIAGGDSITKIDGFPLFVPALYPGDRATVEINEVKSGFARGAVVSLLERSPLRRLEPCPVAEVCGGCDWTSLRLDAQLHAKQEILQSSLQRVGKLPLSDLPPVTLHASPLRYRLRSRLQVSREGQVGFFTSGSHQVVPLPEECEVVGPQLIRNLSRLRAHAGSGEVGSIETFESDEQFHFGPPEDSERGTSVSVDVGPFHYELSTQAFFQVNRHLLRTLLDLVIAAGSRARFRNAAFDLYAGVGFFTLPLARLFDSVYSVEESAVSHRYARLNARGYPNAQLFGESVETFLKRGLREVDFVMLDPPRAGLDPVVIESIDSSMAQTICYLSCDPVTFARDAGRLARRGWSLTTLDLVDLFPNTHHIETLSSFERVG